MFKVQKSSFYTAFIEWPRFKARLMSGKPSIAQQTPLEDGSRQEEIETDDRHGAANEFQARQILTPDQVRVVFDGDETVKFIAKQLGDELPLSDNSTED